MFQPEAVGSTTSVLSPKEFQADGWKRSGLLLAIGIATYIALAVGMLRSSGRGANSSVVMPELIDSSTVPAWMSGAEIKRLNNLGDAVRGRSVFDYELTTDLAHSYAQNPWVEEVLYARRSYPNKLDVALIIRQPIAYIPSRTGPSVTLDKFGFRLPVTADNTKLVKIIGVKTKAPVPGEQWEEVNVRDGLRALAHYSETLPLLDKKVAEAFAPITIDVTNWSSSDSRPVVIIRTKNNADIIWGVTLPKGNPSIAEPSDEEKCEMMKIALPKVLNDIKPGCRLSFRSRSGVTLKYTASQRRN